MGSFAVFIARNVEENLSLFHMPVISGATGTITHPFLMNIEAIDTFSGFEYTIWGETAKDNNKKANCS